MDAKADKTAVDANTTAIAGKADQTAVDTLESRVTTNESAITTEAAKITALQTSVAGKADQTTVDANTTAIAGKADAAALTALTQDVEATERAITVNQSNIALLEAVLDGLMLGPVQNTFVGDDRTAAESDRDTYAADNADWLTSYDGDATLHIRMRAGGITIYQNRQSGAWADVVADPRASGSALTALTNRVTENETDITTEQNRITTLQAEVDGKAAASAIDLLQTEIDTNEAGIAANAASIQSLRVAAGGFVAGPVQNRFRGADQATAATVRDTYAADNADWLAHYDMNANNYILLEFYP